jgi:hypothetical protein
LIGDFASVTTPFAARDHVVLEAITMPAHKGSASPKSSWIQALDPLCAR